MYIDKKEYKALHTTSGFTQAGVYARRQFCGDLEVCRPPEPLWNPRLREAATTLSASGDDDDVEKVADTENGVQSDNAVEIFAESRVQPDKVNNFINNKTVKS